MRKILAVDAGGTSTRAAIVDVAGRCLGYGRAGSGNVLAAGFDAAIGAVAAAVADALATDRTPTDADSVTLVALAGSHAPPFADRAAERCASLGFAGRVIIESDVLGTYFSGTASPRGCGLVAGTGAVACRVTDGVIERLSGGTGWLLGDAGSGFWIGHQAARAVVADLDGAAERTALTPEVLAEFGFVDDGTRTLGQPSVLHEMIESVARERPAGLARLAPLVLQCAAEGDTTAAHILDRAADALVALLGAVHDRAATGPIVLGGGLLSVSSPLTERLTECARGSDLAFAPDGIVGAALLGLRHVGIRLDDDLFARVRRVVRERSVAGSPRSRAEERAVGGMHA